jgi:hypothetical protein
VRSCRNLDQVVVNGLLFGAAVQAAPNAFDLARSLQALKFAA